MKLISILFLSLLSLAVNAQGLMTPETLFRLKRLSEPVLSPDASKVVYSVRTMNLEANNGNTDLYILDLKTNSTEALVADADCNESSASFSGDGSRVYFLSDKGGSSQIWSIASDGTGLKKLSEQSADINCFGISPDGRKVWFAMDVKIEKVTGAERYTDLPKSTGKVYDDLMMRRWNRWEDGSYSHLFVADFDGSRISSTPVDLMKGEAHDSPMQPHGGVEQINWSPDGKTLAYTCKRSTGLHYATHTNSDVYLYDVSSGQTTNISSGMLGYDKNPVFSPDNTKVLWQSQAEDGNEADRDRIFVYDRLNKTSKEITTGFDLSVESAIWSSDSKKIYFLAVTQATSQVFVYDSGVKKGSPITQLTTDIADYSEMTLALNAAKKDVLVCSRMSMSSPGELFNVDVKTGAARQITFTNKEILDTVSLGEVRKRMVKASDGKDILTWVIYPPGFDPAKKYPALLYCQGGPQSPLSQFFSYRWNFQLMAANGYIIVAPNRRGMPGFGTQWNDQISEDWGGQAMRDLLSAIDDVSKEPYVNKDKLGAVGASYGGFSVFWLEGHHEKRFKTFISHCGVFNMESMLATEELFFYEHENGGYYWENPVPKSYAAFSPHRFVSKWDTPILIISNELDYRVPYSQGLEAYSAARLKNIPSRFISFPDEGHWVLKPQNAVQWQREFFSWLDQYLK